MARHTSIAIIGGGVAGLCLAIALQNRGIPFVVYEGAHAFGEVGGGLAIAPNAIRALEGVGQNIHEAVQRASASSTNKSKSQQWFTFRYGYCVPGHQDAEEIVKIVNPSGLATVRRSILLESMFELLPNESVQFDKRVVKIDDLGGSNGVRLHFKDGMEALHSAVVGCDGVKSQTRMEVLGEDDPAAYPAFAKEYCHRGLVSMDKAIEAIGEELATSGNVYAGKHGHVSCFPINDKFVNVTAFHRAESWSSDEWVIGSDTRRLQKDFEDWGPTVRNLVGLMENTDIWSLFDSYDRPARTYFKGNICIIGDAAHSSTPFQGAGSSMGMEDAYVLSELLDYGLEKNVPIAEAFNAYDGLRRFRTQLMVATSREAGLLWAFEHSEVGHDGVKLAERAANRMQWIWDGDIAGQVDQGKRFLNTYGL